MVHRTQELRIPAHVSFLGRTFSWYLRAVNSDFVYSSKTRFAVGSAVFLDHSLLNPVSVRWPRRVRIPSWILDSTDVMIPGKGASRGYGNRVFVAKNGKVFIVGAKRFRCAEVLFQSGPTSSPTVRLYCSRQTLPLHERVVPAGIRHVATSIFASTSFSPTSFMSLSWVPPPTLINWWPS